MTAKFMIIDGNSLANRAFYAIPMLSNSQGFITNAIYGFSNMLFRILDEEKPEYLAVAFDKGRVVFRHQDFGDYKAHRKATPDELRPQFPVLKDLLLAMNIAIYELEGYEADDIIGTMVKRAEKAGLQSLIVTGDRDALQLISPQTTVLLTRKGISELDLFDPTALQDKYGVSPCQMIDVKGLMGDSSDNIPGIPGVGEKTALKLIQEYGSLENALKHKEDFKGKKLGELLGQYAEQAILSKKLATIHCEVPLATELDECRRNTPDYPRLVQMLQELEFKNILQAVLDKMKIGDNQPQVLTEDRSQGQVIDDPALLQEYLENTTDWLGLILRSEKKGIIEVGITSLGLLGRNQEAVALRWQGEEGLRDLLAVLKPYLERKDLIKATHDAKVVILTLWQYGIEIQGIATDIQLMSYLLNPARPATGFLPIVQEYLNRHIPNELGEEALYSQLQALADLSKLLEAELENNKLLELYQELELPLSRVLAEMERTGVYLDKKVLVTIGKELQSRIAALTGDIYAQAGEQFNINSPKQLGVILFEKLGLAKGKKTKTGYSTSVEVLEALAPEHEIIAKIMEYRQLVKLNSTYIEGLQAIMVPETGKVHTSLNQVVTATGRLSSTEPNLQNIPIRLEEGRRIRKAFLPSPGNLLLSADYSQIELRVLAHIADDPVLKEAFLKDQDIHTRTAAEVFGVPMELVNKDMRRAAKAVNFGIVYGISDFGLGQDLGISRGEARAYIENYFARYSGVKDYIQQVIAEAREKGFVTTILQRRRYLPDILSSNFHLRSFAERTAMNTPIQGSAADIIKLAMLQIQAVIERDMPDCRMLLQVHDELIFDVPREKLEAMSQIVNRVMSRVYPLAVPLKVDLQAGPNWYDLTPVTVDSME